MTDRTQISNDEMFSILESTEAELRQAEANEAPWLQNVAGLFYQLGWLMEQVTLGRYKAATIKIENEPAYVVFYSINDQGWLVVHCFTALRTASLAIAQQAVEDIARHLQCGFIQVDTKVRSMFRVCLDFGYQPMGVVLLKKLPEVAP